MIEKYIALNRLLRGLHARCQDGVDAEPVGTDGYAQAAISEYVLRDVRDMERIWPRELGSRVLDEIRDAARQGTPEGFQRIVSEILPEVEDRIDDHFSQA